jgi:NADPH-dependent glutamate synthase beta subunit-like oxidoreductase
VISGKLELMSQTGAPVHVGDSGSAGLAARRLAGAVRTLTLYRRSRLCDGDLRNLRTPDSLLNAEAARRFHDLPR